MKNLTWDEVKQLIQTLAEKGLYTPEEIKEYLRRLEQLRSFSGPPQMALVERGE